MPFVARTLPFDHPLYSKADEVLYMLGQSYEAEIKMTRSHPDCVTANFSASGTGSS